MRRSSGTDFRLIQAYNWSKHDFGEIHVSPKGETGRLPLSSIILSWTHGIRHFEVARETGSRWLSSALWDCFEAHIFNIVANLSKQSHNALSRPARPGLPRNLKVANTACTQMRHSEQTKGDTDTPEQKNDVTTAALLHTVVFIDCAGLLVSYIAPSNGC